MYMGKITYQHLSSRDLNDAQVLLKARSYSSAGRFAQQAVEKKLKQYIEDNGDTSDIGLLSTHNTTKLYDRVVDLGGLVKNKDHRTMMAVLKDYYYDINYPGENSRELDEEEAAEAVKFADEFIKFITPACTNAIVPDTPPMQRQNL